MALAQYREAVVEVPGAFLEPYLRAQVVEGYTDQVQPIVRRSALAQTTEAEALPR